MSILITKAGFDAYYSGHPFSSTQVTMAIAAVEAQIESYTNRSFALADHTEWIALGNKTAVALKQTPLVSVTSVGYAAIKDSENVSEISAYSVDEASGLLYLEPNYWPVHYYGTIYGTQPSLWLAVEYRAGYVTADTAAATGTTTPGLTGGPNVPADLAQVALEMTYFSLAGATSNPGFQSEKIGDYQYTRAGDSTSSSLINAFAQRLATYRRVLL